MTWVGISEIGVTKEVAFALMQCDKSGGTETGIANRLPACDRFVVNALSVVLERVMWPLFWVSWAHGLDWLAMSTMVTEGRTNGMVNVFTTTSVPSRAVAIEVKESSRSNYQVKLENTGERKLWMTENLEVWIWVFGELYYFLDHLFKEWVWVFYRSLSFMESTHIFFCYKTCQSIDAIIMDSGVPRHLLHDSSHLWFMRHIYQHPHWMTKAAESLSIMCAVLFQYTFVASAEGYSPQVQ